MTIFKINPCIFIVIAISYITGNIYGFAITFLSMAMHELVHLILMSKKHCVIEKITVEPFGISINAKNPHDVAPVVFVGAPLFNIAISFLFLYLYKYLKNEAFMFIFETNLILGLFNLLPILPFDGGRFLISIFEKKGKNPKKFITFFSITIGIIIVFLGIVFLKITNYNFSICLIGSFIVYNAFCENENKNIKNSKTILKKSKQITKKEVTKTLSVPYFYSAHKLIKDFLGDEYYIVNVIKDGKIIKTVTENEIIEKVINSDKNLKICEV